MASDKPIIEYTLLMAQSGQLPGLVNMSIANNWQPYGSPQFIYRGVKLGVWAYQAMVKYGETK